MTARIGGDHEPTRTVTCELFLMEAQPMAALRPDFGRSSDRETILKAAARSDKAYNG